MSATSRQEPQSPFRRDILAGRRALLTGGGSGIGLEIARQLGLHGARVLLMGRREDVLRSAVNALRAESIDVYHHRGDVRQYADCEAAIAACQSTLGGLDILVNAAAGNFLCPAENLSANGFATVMGIDVQGTFNVCRAAYRTMTQSQHPCIINISATLHLPATHYQSHAAAAKAAVDSLTRSLSLEWGNDNIRVTGIAPGPIANTPGQMKLGGALQHGETSMLEQIPLRTLGRTFDIAIMAVFLASDACQWVTGQTFIVDGGANNWRPPIASKKEIQNFARQIEAKSRQEGTKMQRAKL